MTYTEKHIIDTYSSLLQGLSSIGKIELIERLSKLLKTPDNSKESLFFKSFGAFDSEKSAEDIIEDIKSSRKFTKKNIKM